MSGVVVFARNTKAARRLAEQFQKHQVRKVYWAAVEGDVAPAEGAWEDWLLKIAEEARIETVAPTRRARARRCSATGALGSEAGCSLLEIEPQTGRMHQIRVQAARRGWPIRGDVLYGAQLPSARRSVAARARHRAARPQPDVSAPDSLRADHRAGPTSLSVEAGIPCLEPETFQVESRSVLPGLRRHSNCKSSSSAPPNPRSWFLNRPELPSSRSAGAGSVA